MCFLAEPSPLPGNSSIYSFFFIIQSPQMQSLPVQSLDAIFFNILSKSATVVEGDQKVPFSIVTTPRCRGGNYSFSLDCSTLPFTLIILSVKQGGIKYHFFKVFGMTQPGIKPRSPGPLANTLPTRPSTH